MVTQRTPEQFEPIGATDGAIPIDIRPTAGFNGWKLGDEARGGHIPGAISFPFAWSVRLYDSELVDRLAAKGVTPAQNLIIYGTDDQESLDLGRRLETLGFDGISYLVGGQPAWAADGGRELRWLPGYRRLPYPAWLDGLIAGKDVEAAPDRAPVVFHVNFGVPDDYRRGHIPGSFHLDTNVLESSVDWNRRSPEELQAALARLGITADTPVVLYGNDTARDPRDRWPGRRAGQIAATRAAAILVYTGVQDVRLLDGGLNAWRASRFEVETTIRTPAPVTEVGTQVPAVPDVFIDFEEATELLDDPDGVLVSIRSRPENVGQTSGYKYIEERGDIPGAVWGDNGTDAYHMENYRNIDNTMRDFNEIAANWKGAGITADKRVSFYCGTGWRASETFFYASLMDWPEVSIYDGGWFEWTRRTGVTGIAKDTLS